MSFQSFANGSQVSIDASSSIDQVLSLRSADAARVLPVHTLIPGPVAAGPLLMLSAPISFWGGIDPKTSMVADVRHPEHGVNIAGTILYLPGTIGSSSASAVLLELIHKGIAPKAIILREPDAILLLGVLVAREMGWATPAAYRLT